MDEQGLNESVIQSVIESAIAGDREALNLLWKNTRSWVAAILLAHKPRDADLEDLLQTVAMQMCKHISDVRDPNALKSWLRTVSINAARQEGRKVSQRRRSILKLVGIEQMNHRSTHQPDECVHDAADSQRIYDAAMSLPIGYREPVLLRCMRSMSYQQIADVLDLPVTTIETRIARGRRMLRELVQQRENDSTTTATRANEFQKVGSSL